MNVCQDCGLNIAIFVDHAPGCQFRKSSAPGFSTEGESLEESSPIWTALMEVSTERGLNLSKTLLRNAMHEALDVDQNQSIDHLDDVLFDDATMKIVGMCSWAGVISAVQVLMEQGLLDREAVLRYLSDDSDGTI